MNRFDEVYQEMLRHLLLCSFGYHLGVVNGPLAAIASILGFEGNAQLQGLVRILLSAGDLFLKSAFIEGHECRAV